MRAWVRSLCVGSVASLAVGALACGSKGSDDDSAAANGGTGNTATAGSSGTTATGGMAAGATAAGGSSTSSAGTGGATMKTKIYSFDADLEGWDFVYGSSGALPGDAGTATVIKKTDPGMTVKWVATGGDPASTPGAMEIDIPFTSAAQYVGVGINLGLAITGQAQLDLTGKVLTANVKLVSQAGDATDLMNNPDGAKLYAKSGMNYVYAAGAHLNTTVGTWTTLSLDFSAPSSVDETNGTFDPSDIREIGVQLETSGTTTTAMSAVVLVDTITY